MNSMSNLKTEPLLYMVVVLASILIAIIVMIGMGVKAESPILNTLATAAGMTASGIVGYAAPHTSKSISTPDVQSVEKT